MLKKEIEYEDFDGNTVKRTFYFNLNKAEMAEMELRFGDAGLENHFRKVAESGDRAAILDIFKYILSSTVGQRVGNLFVKNDEIKNDFLFSGAYDVMFIDLFTNPQLIVEFFREVIPKKNQAQFDEHVARSGTMSGLVNQSGVQMAQVELPVSNAPPFDLAPTVEENTADSIKPPADGDTYSHSELVAMPQEHFDTLFGTDHRKWPRIVMNAAFQRKLSGEQK